MGKASKGFTLMEMLTVVAVIAVLVAIILPAASSAITKANAAADAANLRVLAAEAAADYLTGKSDTNGMVHFTAPGTFKIDHAPAAKTKGCQDWAANILFDSSTQLITARYGSKDSDYFAEIADSGKIPSQDSASH